MRFAREQRGDCLLLFRTPHSELRTPFPSSFSFWTPTMPPHPFARCLRLILIAILLMPTLAFAQTKSPKKAALLSILLPGAGEHYAGGHKSARFFLFAEGVFWTGLFGFKKLNSARENTFKAFAAAHAGAAVHGKPNSYFDRLSGFDSIYDYNARRRYLEGNLAQPMPDTPDNHWEWDARASREQFRELRSKATWARTRGSLFIGALIFNRFASALNAAHLSHNANAALAPRPEGGAQAQIQIKF